MDRRQAASGSVRLSLPQAQSGLRVGRPGKPVAQTMEPAVIDSQIEPQRLRKIHIRAWAKFG
jgi:hypothetical protein